jgi:hypothetical protein
MTSEPITSLEEAAQALEAARLAHASAVRRWKELCPAYDAAHAHMRETAREVERIEQGMTHATRAYAVVRALNELGVDYDGPPVFFLRTPMRVDPYFLAAIGPQGTGLYLRSGPRRYGGKVYAILEEVAVRHGVDNAAERAAYRTGEQTREAGLREWWERGVGDFGAGSGAVKPKGPPEGGRWKWLKVREQEALPA